jgi:hypothetical protein
MTSYVSFFIEALALVTVVGYVGYISGPVARAHARATSFALKAALAPPAADGRRRAAISSVKGCGMETQREAGKCHRQTVYGSCLNENARTLPPY